MVCVDIYIYIYQYLSIYLFIYLSIYLSFYLPIFLSIYLSIYQSINLSIYLSIHPSIHPSIYLSVCLSVCLSVYLFSLSATQHDTGTPKSSSTLVSICALFQHLNCQLPEVVWSWFVTWKSASRHNGVHFVRHLNFQEWSDPGVLCRISWIRPSRHKGVQLFRLRTRRFSEPDFRPSRPNHVGKT